MWCVLHVRSSVCGWYQKDSVAPPVAGTLMVCGKELSPSGSRPLVTPSSADLLPVCARRCRLRGDVTPPVAQDVSPVSKPPLAR